MNAVTQDIDRLLDKTKGQLFFKKGSGFLGALLCKLKFKWTTELQTAAISSSTLYWNPDFFLSLDQESRVTVLAHELWHNAYLHGARLNQRCPDVWNIAGDHVINLMLKEHGYYMGGFPYVMDDQFKDWTTDEIYDFLQKQGENPEPDPLGRDVMPMSAAEVDQAVTDVIAAANTARITGKPGDIPGEIQVVLDTFLNPKLPWKTLLFNYMNELVNQEYSYARPSRRYEDPLMPGYTGRNGLEHLVYYVDVSGSVTDDQILRMNSEVKYIQEELQPEKLTLALFDTEIHEVYVFERDEPFSKITVTGRGGTSLECVFEHVRSQDASAIVVFSDLDVSIPDDPGIPIIWVCVDSPQKTVPYGRLVHVSD